MDAVRNRTESDGVDASPLKTDPPDRGVTSMFGIGPVIMPATIRPVMGPATPEHRSQPESSPRTIASTRASAEPCTAAWTTTRTAAPSTISIVAFSAPRPLLRPARLDGLAHNHWNKLARVRLLAKPTPPGEQHTGVDRVAARHHRDRMPIRSHRTVTVSWFIGS